jgi:CBS domain-containing protein
MTRNPESLTPDDPIAFAMQLMSVGGFRHVPLVDSDGRPVGILSVKDIVDYLVEHIPGEILNIPPEPGKHARVPEGA